MKTFYIKQKIFSIGDKYNVFDESQNVIYYIKQQLFSFRATFHFFENRTNTELYCIKRKILTFLPKYLMYDTKENIVATVSKRFTLFTHRISIDSSLGNLEILGDFFAHSFEIKKDDVTIVTVRKKWLSWGDTYEITIADESNVSFYLALVIIIDNCLHDENNNNNNNN